MPPIEPLSTEVLNDLSAACRGEVCVRGDVGFDDYALIFNGNVVNRAKAVVCPLDAQDVSRIVLVCIKHSLSPSVKAGGYGTAGWAVGGDVIIDVNKLGEIDIELPKADGSFTSLRDVAPAASKGKDAVQSSAAGGGQGRREEDSNLRHYDSASQAVASFLLGPLLPSSESIAFSPHIRLPEPMTSTSAFGSASGFSQLSGNLDIASSPFSYPEPLSRQHSRVSGSDYLSTFSDPLFEGSISRSISTAFTTPPFSPIVDSGLVGNHFTPESYAPGASGAGPFGYLDQPSNFPPASEPLFISPHYSQSLGPWTNASGLGSPFGQMTIPFPAQAEPIHPFCYVTFGAGLRQKEIDTYTANHKLEARYLIGGGDGIPYHVPFSAHPVGSSVMLLGGFGFLSRLHGLSIDNLVEVEMVLADGRIVVASESEYPDLWWALRGAGPCMGIATRYKAKAYPVPVVFAGNLIYRFNTATAPSLIKHFRDCVKGAPRELYANVILTAGPAGKDSLVVIQMCYIGPREKGQEYLHTLSSWDGESCLLHEVDEKSFLHQQDSVAQILRGKAGRQWYIRSALISSLPDDLINETVIKFANTPVGCTWLFEIAGGAIADFEDNCVPKSQREAPFTVAALHQWEMDVHDDSCVDSAEEWVFGTLKQIQLGGPFPSFLGRHEPLERTKGCFGTNWERLCEIKKFYDPKNLFKNTLWPLTETGEEVEAHMHEPPTPPFLPTSIRGKKKKVFIKD